MNKKGKYNDLSSYDIYALPHEELKIAIHDWAEGDPIMEELLWKCYNSGVETKGCHAGANPYLSISADKSIDKIKNMLAAVYGTDGFSVCIFPDGGNALSGDIFYKPDLLITFLKTKYEEEANEIFRKMIISLDEKETKTNKLIDSIIDLYDFFKGKESELNFRVVLDGNIFKFFVELNSPINFDYYCDLFNEANLLKNDSKQGVWYFSSNDINDFSNKIEYVKKILISKYNLELPSKIEYGMSFNELFRVLRRKYIEIYGDDLNFKEFKNKFEQEFNKKENEMFDRIITGEELFQWVYERIYSEEEKISSIRL